MFEGKGREGGEGKKDVRSAFSRFLSRGAREGNAKNRSKSITHSSRCDTFGYSDKIFRKIAW